MINEIAGAADPPVSLPVETGELQKTKQTTQEVEADESEAMSQTSECVAVWLQRLEFDQVFDPRQRRGKRWKLPQVLAACLLGHMAGCKSLLEVEQLTDGLSHPVRRKLGLQRRLASPKQPSRSRSIEGPKTTTDRE